MITKHPSHFNPTHSCGSMLSSHFVIISLQKIRSPITIALMLQKTSDGSSHFSDLSQEQMKRTSFTNLFITDQILNFYTMLSLFGIYLKCFGLIKRMPTVFYTNIYLLDDKHTNKA